jgi:hypothetical protein
MPAIAALADEIAAVEDEQRQKSLTLALRDRVKGNPRARVLLNNHPTLKKYA